MKKLLLVLLSLGFLVSNASADGCFPGEPCYYKKPAAPAQAKPVMPAVVKSEPVAMETVSSDTFYVSLGGGFEIREKDNELLDSHTFDVRFGGYHIAPRISAEVGFGFSPDIRNRQHPGANRFFLSEDTSAIRFFGDVMYHLEEDSKGAEVDPYVALGLGVNKYEDPTSDGNTALYAQTGVGAFLNLTPEWFVKPDYRIQMVGENTQVNHLLTLSVGYKFDI